MKEIAMIEKNISSLRSECKNVIFRLMHISSIQRIDIFNNVYDDSWHIDEYRLFDKDNDQIGGEEYEDVVFSFHCINKGVNCFLTSIIIDEDSGDVAFTSMDEDYYGYEDDDTTISVDTYLEIIKFLESIIKEN